MSYFMERAREEGESAGNLMLLSQWIGKAGGRMGLLEGQSFDHMAYLCGRDAANYARKEAP